MRHRPGVRDMCCFSFLVLFFFWGEMFCAVFFFFFSFFFAGGREGGGMFVSLVLGRGDALKKGVKILWFSPSSHSDLWRNSGFAAACDVKGFDVVKLRHDGPLQNSKAVASWSILSSHRSFIKNRIRFSFQRRFSRKVRIPGKNGHGFGSTRRTGCDFSICTLVAKPILLSGTGQ